MSEAILELTNVSKTYGGVRANTNVSLTVPRGSITGLIGPNGSGTDDEPRKAAAVKAPVLEGAE